MKVRIVVTIDLDLNDRKAVSFELAQHDPEFEGAPATREQIREFFENELAYKLNDVRFNFENFGGPP